MAPNMHLYEKAREEHYRDLRREAETRRLLACLPRRRRSMSRCAAVQLGLLLVKLGLWLKQFEQPATALGDHIPVD